MFRVKSITVWFVAFGIFVLVFWVSHLRPEGSREQSPPLPGTFQYFHEKDFFSKSHRLGAVSHCDTRFAPERELSYDELRTTLIALLDSYATQMERLGVETWMAHGTLLGWFWNKKLLPWDTDIDVQMSAGALYQLATKHNMTEFEHTTSGTSQVRKYLLDINPHFSIVTSQDVANKIDGRWIDLSNGKYIDITALHMSDSDNQADELLFCKDEHRYRVSCLLSHFVPWPPQSMLDHFGPRYYAVANPSIEGRHLPFAAVAFEGVQVNVPRDSQKVLREEYGASALKSTSFHWHKFNRASQMWEPQ